MLVLSVPIGGKVWVNNAFIQFCELQTNGSVRLGFEFPKEVRIERHVVRQKRLKAEAEKEAA